MLVQAIFKQSFAGIEAKRQDATGPLEMVITPYAFEKFEEQVQVLRQHPMIATIYNLGEGSGSVCRASERGITAATSTVNSKKTCSCGYWTQMQVPCACALQMYNQCFVEESKKFPLLLFGHVHLNSPWKTALQQPSLNAVTAGSTDIAAIPRTELLPQTVEDERKLSSKLRIEVGTKRGRRTISHEQYKKQKVECPSCDKLVAPSTKHGLHACNAYRVKHGGKDRSSGVTNDREGCDEEAWEEEDSSNQSDGGGSSQDFSPTSFGEASDRESILQCSPCTTEVRGLSADHQSSPCLTAAIDIEGETV